MLHSWLSSSLPPLDSGKTRKARKHSCSSSSSSCYRFLLMASVCFHSRQLYKYKKKCSVRGRKRRVAAESHRSDFPFRGGGGGWGRGKKYLLPSVREREGGCGNHGVRRGQGETRGGGRAVSDGSSSHPATGEPPHTSSLLSGTSGRKEGEGGKGESSPKAAAYNMRSSPLSHTHTLKSKAKGAGRRTSGDESESCCCCYCCCCCCCYCLFSRSCEDLEEEGRGRRGERERVPVFK